MSVTAGKKVEFEKDIQRLQGLRTAPNTEKDAASSEDKEEYVLVAGWESRKMHFAIADTDIGPKLTAFTSLLEGRESRHDRRLL
ncbi:uncharacterized protein SPSK_10673 [Sporothrix schenckii 1099-18]|uniref:Uncharacterized protein n=1 Tax=Sporothrix schenckii 1099-18 TaxID=1397361 RepID=A0A0F2LV77_SPOSC|nr:uncharacterized protein SPSK_10673 [Sporothrix schenckii 1099-18]KJR80744.1 hypothetical protein SPSK_10673 [Sporothrix schenckii 1099-18]